jgi:ABC-type lipoprotein export system ATPase subunit
MPNDQHTAGPDITVLIYGGKGSGKSSLMGDLHAMLKLYGCEVRCFRSEGARDVECRPPDEGQFNATRRIKIVEMCHRR